MKIIYLLTDYLNRFGSKHNSKIYKDGMDKVALAQNFLKFGYKTTFLPLNKIDFRNSDWKDKIVLYSSQEDVGHFYKSFVEDIIYGLDLAGAKLIPSYKYLRAHSNKVFMEILRDLIPDLEIKNLTARHYGALEEAMQDANNFNYPVVIKGAEGAMSKNVALANNKKELEKTIKKMAATRNFKEEAREYIRSKKYKDYQMQSKYRREFIIQDFLPGLENDWKVLVFGDKFYIVERKVRKNDFRASGGGLNSFGSNVNIPRGIFETAMEINNKLKIPMVSLDFAQYNKKLYVLEFQALYFGTSGQWKSDSFYQFDGNNFIKTKNTSTLEEVYVESVAEYLEKA